MSDTVYRPGPRPRSVCLPDGSVLDVPAGWELLAPGDAGMTRRVKAAGPHWGVQEKRGRKTFSKGVWADAATIARIQKELELERSTGAYAKRKAADAKRREREQLKYVEEFQGAVYDFLNFASVHHDSACLLARLVAEHATPVGSGTVARTKRIPVEQRAEAAVIAWMRHQTTAYDSMSIPRIKGKRREVRRMLAKRSHELLQAYRQGGNVRKSCPLQIALSQQQEDPQDLSGDVSL